VEYIYGTDILPKTIDEIAGNVPGRTDELYEEGKGVFSIYRSYVDYSAYNISILPTSPLPPRQNFTPVPRRFIHSRISAISRSCLPITDLCSELINPNFVWTTATGKTARIVGALLVYLDNAMSMHISCRASAGNNIITVLLGSPHGWLAGCILRLLPRLRSRYLT